LWSCLTVFPMEGAPIALVAIRSAEIGAKTVAVGTGANQTGSNPLNWEPCLTVDPIILCVKSIFGPCDGLKSSKNDTKKKLILPAKCSQPISGCRPPFL
jgi:hypothetical protein